MAVARKTRADAVLPHLSEELRERLASWLLGGLSHDAAAARAALPVAEGGLGVAVGRSAVARFWQSDVVPMLLARRRDAAETARRIGAEVQASPAGWDESAVELIQQRAFEALLLPGTDPKAVTSLVNAFLKLREQALDARRLALQEKRAKLAEEAEAVAEGPLSDSEKRDRLAAIFGIARAPEKAPEAGKSAKGVADLGDYFSSGKAEETGKCAKFAHLEGEKGVGG